VYASPLERRPTALIERDLVSVILDFISFEAYTILSNGRGDSRRSGLLCQLV